MKAISKQQAIELARHGYKWRIDIFKTTTKHPKYYACERLDILKFLNRKD